MDYGLFEYVVVTLAVLLGGMITTFIISRNVVKLVAEKEEESKQNRSENMNGLGDIQQVYQSKFYNSIFWLLFIALTFGFYFLAEKLGTLDTFLEYAGLVLFTIVFLAIKTSFFGFIVKQIKKAREEAKKEKADA